MTILSVRHLTRYRYAKRVSFGEHRMMFRPRESFDQHVLESVLRITPEPSYIRYVHDVFGNSIGIAHFATRAKELVFESINRLEHHPENSLDHPGAHDRTLNAFPFVYDAVDEPDLLPSRERIHPDPERVLETWSRRFLVGLTTLDAPHILAAMTLAIHDELAYQTRPISMSRRAKARRRIAAAGTPMPGCAFSFPVGVGRNSIPPTAWSAIAISSASRWCAIRCRRRR